MKVSPVSIVLFVFALLVGCGDQSSGSSPASGAEPYIIAVNNPLLYFSQRLIGDDIEIRLPVPNDIDPATWQPAVDDVLLLQGAELLLLNGAGYSSWLNKVSVSPRKLVFTAGEKEQWIELSEQVTHSHGPGAEHAHGGYAFTTWMDMSLARTQAEAVAAALQKRWPEFADRIAANMLRLKEDLDELDLGYRWQARRLANRQLIYSHPVYQYFERRYQLPGESLHWEPDEMPPDVQWDELEAMISTRPLFIWEAEPAAEIAHKMALMGLPYVVVDPAANISSKDWLSVQRQNLVRLSSVIHE
jgi:zinc transport system substrate-binding protein